LARLGRWRDAHRRLTAASALHPADPALSLALARLLAAAPDDTLRNGSQARSIADTVMRAAPSLDALEVLAMSLAESGEFERAAAVQKDALARAEQTGQRHLLAHFGADLRLYESRRPCRTPWHLEPMYVPPGL
jgi:hypothetical protein